MLRSARGCRRATLSEQRSGRRRGSPASGVEVEPRLAPLSCGEGGGGHASWRGGLQGQRGGGRE